VHRTPTLTSASLAREAGVPVYLKAELFQRTGSFKPRGVLNKLASLSPEEKARGVIGISAGNHAQALAYASALDGVDALVVTWQGASEQKLEATRNYGATVDLQATDPAEAFDRLHVLMDQTGRTLVHPFDDPLVIAGQGTVGLELAEDAPDADVVVGKWKDGRLGTVRALRPYGKFGAVVFRPDEKVNQSDPHSVDSYRPLLVEIVKFFETKEPPFPNEDTLEMFAFMDAAQRSKEAGGVPMKLR